MSEKISLDSSDKLFYFLSFGLLLKSTKYAFFFEIKK